MWKKRTLAILTAAAMACSAIQPLAAQGYNDREYGGSYNDRYGSQYGNDYGRYDNGQYNNQYNNNDYDRDRYDRDQYERDRYNYERDRDRYDANRRAAAFDRVAYLRDCERQRQGNTAGGAIVGALAGGLLGNAISRGPQRGAGTAVGAIFGGVLGAAIGNKMTCEDRSYAVDASYRGFEAGRPHTRYDWRSPRGPYGYVEVQDYYRDRTGYRCANYTQQIWVEGRPETASGRACRQPDGTWAFVG
jgi:surface antigen